MNESIFEGNLFGNGSIAGTPADEDVEEFIDIPEADDESSSEGDTPGGNILELLSRMRGLMPNSDGDEDMDDNDMDSDDYHNKAVDRARRGRNREATDICMEGLKNSHSMWIFLRTLLSIVPKPEICRQLQIITPS